MKKINETIFGNRLVVIRFIIVYVIIPSRILYTQIIFIAFYTLLPCLFLFSINIGRKKKTKNFAKI